MLPAKMSNLTAVVLDTDMDATLRLLASTELVHFSDVKESQKKHLKALAPVEASERFYYLSNLLTRLTSLMTDMQVYRGGSAKHRLEVPDIPDQAYFETMEKKLKAIEDGFTDLTKQFEAAEAAGNKKVKKATKKEIEGYAEEHRYELLGWEELVKREHQIEETKTLFGKTHRTYVMYGWIPAKKEKEFTKILEKHGNNTVSLTIEKHTDKPEQEHYAGDTGPLEGAVTPEEPVAPPTKQENSRWARSAQILTNAFGLPHHTEIDPTWFLLLSLPLFFGLMFGDIGHGLLLVFFSSLGFIAKRRNIDAGEMVNYFIQGSGLLMMLGISSIFFGFLYAEFLGIDIAGLQVGGVYVYQQLKISPFGTGMRDVLLNLFRFFDFEGGINWFVLAESPYNEWLVTGGALGHPTQIWFSAFEMPEHLPTYIASPTWILFVLSIMIGFIHLSIAIGFSAINKLRHRDYRHAIFGPIIWLAFLWGLAYMIFNYGINFMNWPIIDMVLFLILPAVIMFIGGIVVFGFMEGFMEGIEKLIESISNTISYSRILALNMAHAGFAKTFLFIGGVNAAEINSILSQIATEGTMFIVMLIGMLVLASVFVLLMEGLLSFIHSLRLLWVEAFLKFYAGTGYEYTPLELPDKWTTTEPTTKK
ncbi:MAG: V-type ATPase 116kDa subunit family protein [Promethearchaeota archaeon]